MAFTSSWTLLTAASAASTGVASTTFTAATTTGAATSGAAAFLVALAALGAAASTTATGAGVAATGAAGAVFFETVFWVLAAGALIILGAVELFMAGIRIVKRPLESIFDPLFVFCRGQKNFAVTRH